MSEKSFSQILKELSEPFPTSAVQFRAGATNHGKTSAQALAYVDTRDYYDRLDEVVGGENWTVKVEPIGAGAVKVALTIMGVTREEVGEASPEDDNTYTSAYAQAFKRACASFGLGRYLYRLPKVWCAYDADRRKLLEVPVLPEWAVPASERDAYMVLHAGQRKIPVNGYERPAHSQPKGDPTTVPMPQSRHTNGNGQDPADVVVKFGKHRGKTLGQILAEDEGYVRWLAEKSSNQFIAGKARQLLEAQTAPTPAEPETAEAEAEPHDLPVAAAPVPETASSNGNGHEAEDSFGDFDEIPF